MTIPLIKQAGQAEMNACIATILLGFANDPGVRWMYPDPEQYRGNFPRFVAAFGGRAFDQGTAHYVDGYAAAALWLAPGVQPDEEALVALIEHSVSAPHRDAVFALFEAMARYHPSEPHWHLPLIATDPIRQGKGLGSALLRHGLSVCDRQGVPAYLEATSARSVPLYRRHGFEVLGSIEAGTSPPIFPMLRRPQRAGDRHTREGETVCVS